MCLQCDPCWDYKYNISEDIDNVSRLLKRRCIDFVLSADSRRHLCVIVIVVPSDLWSNKVTENADRNFFANVEIVFFLKTLKEKVQKTAFCIIGTS